MKNIDLNKEKNFVSVVAYVKDNEKDIVEFAKKIDEKLNEKFLSYEFIFVNDNSQDNSKEELRKVSDSLNGNVVMIDLAYTHGLESAMLAGVEFAIGDFVFEFDSLLIDYNIDEIFEIYKLSLTGYDVVSATPKEKTKLSSKIFYKLLNKISYQKMDLNTETFRIISRRGLNRVLKNKEKLRYRKALYHYSGFNTYVYSYNPINNLDLSSNLTMIQKASFASDILVNFSNIGTKVASYTACLFGVFACCNLIYTIFTFIFAKNIQLGWTTTMLFLSISFFGLFLVLAIIAKYINIILIEIKNKPDYIYTQVDRMSRK